MAKILPDVQLFGDWGGKPDCYFTWKLCVSQVLTDGQEFPGNNKNEGAPGVDLSLHQDRTAALFPLLFDFDCFQRVHCKKSSFAKTDISVVFF